jgi:ligand-binding sensor domain-containing protein
VGIVVAMTEDTAHDVWAQVEGRHCYLIRIKDLKVSQEISMPSGHTALALAADPRGGIWLGLVNGDLAHYRDGRFERSSLNQGGDAGSVLSLVVDADGSVWGATKQGLFRWKDGKVQTLNSRNAFPCDRTYAVVRDRRGSIWLSTQCGFVAIPDTEMQDGRNTGHKD